MPEKDAFGRDAGEDPLAAMGWSDAGTSALTTPTETDHAGLTDAAAAGASPPPPTPPQTPARPPERPITPVQLTPQLPVFPTAPARRRRRGLVGALAVAGLLLAIVGATGAAVFGLVGDAVDEIADELDGPAVTVPRIGGPDEADVPPPVGLQRRSLLQRRNLVPALERMRARVGGRLRYVRIAPDRIDVQVVTSTQRLRSVQARFDGEVAILSDVSAPGIGAAPSFAWSRVDPSAPRRMVRRALGTRSSRSVDYLVLNDAGGLRWALFLTDGTGFTGAADGRSARRIG